MIADLVPSNHKPLEQALAQTLSPLEAINPVVIEHVWDAWRCPASMLPFLAYALSVDLWNDTWDEITKRRAIDESPAWHRRKGTRGAVEEALAAAFPGRAARVVEWHERWPEARRGTFELQIPLGDAEDLAALASTIEFARRLVREAKPKSRAFSIQLTREIDVALSPSVAMQADERVELFAPPDDVEASMALSAGLMTAETVSLGGF